jgi:hypothetical protein
MEMDTTAIQRVGMSGKGTKDFEIAKLCFSTDIYQFPPCHISVS